MAESADAAPTTTGAAGPDAAEVLGWLGSRLDEIGGASVAKIDGLHVDERTGRPEWLVVRLGRFGHHAVVPAREAVEAAGHVWVPYARDVIKRAPRTDTKSPLNRETELDLLRHYGVAGEAGRAAELSTRGFEAITARPAT
jgi:hypothetical protein